MDTDDPRHGHNRGYVAGCRNDCCRQAHMVWMKRYRMTGTRKVPSLGAQRRIQALAAIGWPLAQQSRHLGHNRNYMRNILALDAIYPTTHEAVAGLYDELCMVVPVDDPAATHPVHRRARQLAARNGWSTPLAWDNIDNPRETPAAPMKRAFGQKAPLDVDESVVLRILGGEWHLSCTPAEKREVVRRFSLFDPLTMAKGIAEFDRPSLAYLERLTGWRPDRYREGAA